MTSDKYEIDIGIHAKFNLEKKKAILIDPSTVVNTDQGLVKNLGKVLFTDYVLPFEISSVLFIAAMVGAVLLAKRDKQLMGQLYRYLGLSVGLIQENMNSNQRRQNYLADITYVTNSQLAFDYFIKRANCKREGFIQEKIDAIFEAARIANFKLDKPWNECEELYKKA